MRNYYYQSRIITEIYSTDAMSRCDVTTLYYDGDTDSHQMWITKRMFEEAMDGDQDTRRAIDATYTELVKSGRI